MEVRNLGAGLEGKAIVDSGGQVIQGSFSDNIHDARVSRHPA